MYTAYGGPLSGESELDSGGVDRAMGGVMPPGPVRTEYSSVRAPVSSAAVDTVTEAFSSGSAPSAVVTTTRSTAELSLAIGIAKTSLSNRDKMDYNGGRTYERQGNKNAGQ